ncbi:MAG: class I SAM-dependent methyltransferase [Planctomycetes bacterium]|nr:class I SAM-dependent methyltransferase [Planctomycetota bacterium]
MAERFEYRYGDVVFAKVIDTERVRFFKNDRELRLDEWNREINRRQSMSVKETHPNPILRLIERLRRLTLLALARPLRDDVVADIGCESGFIAQVFLGRCKALYLVDIDPELLEKAQKRLAGVSQLHFVQSDVTCINLPDNTADVTILSEILEHVPDERAALREACRITKPGGRIIVSVPNDRLILSLKRILGRVLRRRFLGGLSDGLAIGHLRLYTKGSLRCLCSGFGAVQAAYYAPPFLLNIHLAFTPKR